MSTNVCTSEPDSICLFENYPPLLLNAAFGIIILLACIGITSNALTLLALFLYPKLRRNATATFIINLCMADFLFSAFGTPFACTIFWNRRWIYGDKLCVADGIFRYVTVGTSIFTIASITANRYLAIVFTRWYGRVFTRKNNIRIALGTWVLALIFISPALTQYWGKFGYDPEDGVCTVIPSGENEGSSKMFLFLVAAFLPIGFFVVCYSHMFWMVLKIRKALENHSSNCLIEVPVYLKFNGNACDNAKSTLKKQKRKVDKEYRLIKMILVICCTFFVCYLPMTVLKAFRVAPDYPGVQVMAYILFYMTTCVNPFIYVVMSKEYRKAYFALFRMKPSSFVATQTDSSSRDTKETAM